MKRRIAALALFSSIAIEALGTGCASQTHALAPAQHRLPEAGTAALSRQLDAAVARGDTPQIGALCVEQQPAANPLLTKPFPLGAGRARFGLGFEIAAKEDGHANYRSPGSLSWAALFNTEFWIDPRRHVAGVMLMQLLPFYDDGAIRTLRDFEQIVYQHLN